MEQKKILEIDFDEFQKKIGAISDEYSCYHITLTQNCGLEIDREELRSFLQQQMLQLKSQNSHKAAWIKLEGKYIELTSIALSQQFTIHHSKNNYILMYLWLKTNQHFNLPPYPNHMLGCGAFIVNRKENQLLLIQEATQSRQGRWSIPAGFPNNKEFLADTAIRQVKEETGLNTKLYELYGFQYTNLSQWDCENLYFMFVLELIDPNEDKISIDSNELDGAKWIDIDKIEEFIKENKVTNKDFIGKFPEYYHKYMEQDLQKGSTQIIERSFKGKEFQLNPFYPF